MPRFLHRHRSAELLSSLPGLGDLSRLSRSHSLRLSRRRRGDREGRQKKTVAQGLAGLTDLSQPTQSNRSTSTEASDPDEASDTRDSSETYLVDFTSSAIQEEGNPTETSGAQLNTDVDFPVEEHAERVRRNSAQHQRGVIDRRRDATSGTSSLTVRRYPERSGILKLPSFDQLHFEDVFTPVGEPWSEWSQGCSTSPPLTPQKLAISTCIFTPGSESNSYNIKSRDSDDHTYKATSYAFASSSQKLSSQSCLSYHTAAQARDSHNSSSQPSVRSGKVVVKSSYSSIGEKTYAEERLLRNLKELKHSNDGSGDTPGQDTLFNSGSSVQTANNLAEKGSQNTSPCIETYGKTLESIVRATLRLSGNEDESAECRPPKPRIAAFPTNRKWRNDHKNYFPLGSRGLPQDFVVRVCNEYREQVEKARGETMENL